MPENADGKLNELDPRRGGIEWLPVLGFPLVCLPTICGARRPDEHAEHRPTRPMIVWSR